MTVREKSFDVRANTREPPSCNRLVFAVDVIRSVVLEKFMHWGMNEC